MKYKARQIIKQPKLMDGFYIEVRNMGSNERPIKLRSDNKAEMTDKAESYKGNRKEVTILGEYKDEAWVKAVAVSRKKILL